MKKIILFGIAALILVQIAYAANVAVIARFKDSTEQNWCVFVEEGGTGKDALDATDLILEWSGSGSMAYLISVNGILPDYANNEGWSFWHQNSNGDAFELSSVGFGGYAVSSTGTIIGLSYSDYDPVTYEFLTPPTFIKYEEICEKLSIEEVTAYVDGDKETLDEGDKIRDVKPESKLKLKIKVKNLYEEDIEIKDITITAVIKDIDDGDDLEEETYDLDLDHGDSETETIEFEIPLEVEDGTYDLTLEIEGKDNRNVEYSKTYEYSIEVEKEKHDVVITKAELTSPTLKCSRTTRLDINVINLGTNEEDVVLKVINAELELNKQLSFELSDNPFDDDSKYAISLTITVDNDQEAGVYPIKVSADYGSKTAEETVELRVEDCKIKEEEEKEAVILNIKQKEQELSSEKISNVAEAKSDETKEIKNILTMSSAVLVYIVIIICGVALIVWLFKK